MLPADWKPIDSLATLMVAVAQADAPPDRKELDTVTGRLAVLFPRQGADRVGDAVQRSLEHLVLQVNQGVGQSPADWLRTHCRLLSERYGDEIRRTIVMELARVAKASGGATEPEVALAAGLASELGHAPLGQAMLHQFERARLRAASSR